LFSNIIIIICYNNFNMELYKSVKYMK